MKEQITNLPVEELMSALDQPCNELSEESLLILGQFLKNDGVLQPVRVRPSAEGYLIVSGEQQWQAARIAGVASIACVIETDEMETNCDSCNESDDPDCRTLLKRVLGESAKTVERVLNELPLTQEEQVQTRRKIATELEGDLARVVSAVTLKALIPIITRKAGWHFEKKIGLQHSEAVDLAQELAVKLLGWSKRILDACPRVNAGAFVATTRKNLLKDHRDRNGRWPESFGEKPDRTLFDKRSDPRRDPNEISLMVSEFPVLARQIAERRLCGDDWKDIAKALQLPIKKVKEIVQRAISEGGSSPRSQRRRKARTYCRSTRSNKSISSCVVN